MLRVLIVHSFLLLCSIHCRYTTVYLCTHHRRFWCLLLLAFTNNAAMNIHVQAFTTLVLSYKKNLMKSVKTQGEETKMSFRKEISEMPVKIYLP